MLNNNAYLRKGIRMISHLKAQGKTAKANAMHTPNQKISIRHVSGHTPKYGRPICTQY